MPFDKSNPPDKIAGLPAHAQDVWISAFNSAWEQYNGDEEKCNAVAWSAVEKAGFKKNTEGKWSKEEETKENITRRSKIYSSYLQESRIPLSHSIILEENDDSFTCEVDLINLESPPMQKRGWSLNRRFYTDKALEGLARVMKNRRMMATGHHEGGELTDIAGKLLESWKLPNQKIVKGKAKIFTDNEESKRIKTLIREQIETPDANLTSLSINVGGKHSWGKVDNSEGMIVEDITEGQALDLVFDPGAGGSFKKLIQETKRSKTMELTLQELREARPDLIESILKDEKEKGKLTEEKVKKLEEELTTFKKTEAETKDKELISKLIKESKLTDEQALGLTEEMLGKDEAGKKKLIEQRIELLKSVAAPQKIQNISEKDPDGGLKPLTEIEKTVIKQIGITEEQFRKGRGEKIPEKKKEE